MGEGKRWQQAVGGRGRQDVKAGGSGRYLEAAGGRRRQGGRNSRQQEEVEGIKRQQAGSRLGAAREQARSRPAEGCRQQALHSIYNSIACGRQWLRLRLPRPFVYPVKREGER